MVKTKSIRGPLSLWVLATAMVALFSFLSALITSQDSVLPERLLAQVHGASPSYFRSINKYPNCSAWNVYIENQAGGNYVTWYGCGAITGTACMQCANRANYALNFGAGSPAAFPKPIGVVDCNFPDGGGSVGTCQLISGEVVCNLTDAYDCDQYASTWNLE